VREGVRHAVRASMGFLRDKPSKHRALIAVRASTRQLQHKALHHLVLIVVQVSTRRPQVAVSAQTVKPASRPEQSLQHPIHVATVLQVRSREKEPVHARIASTDNIKMQWDKAHAKRACPESLQGMTIPPNPRAHIASLATTNRMTGKPHASHAILARIKRPPDKPCAHPVPPVCSLPRPLQRMETSV